MLAWEIARQWQSENCMTPFEEILGWHLSGGLIHSTKDVFLLASEVTWDAEQKAIVESRESRVDGQQPNAWFVELAAACPKAQQSNSPIAELMRAFPRPHDHVLWCRQSKGRKHDIHSYRWDHLARKVGLLPFLSAPPCENLQSLRLPIASTPNT